MAGIIDRYLPERFDSERYKPENVEFWLPVFVRLGSIEPHHVVVDLVCGTGGFTAALATTGAFTVGLEANEDLISFGRRARPDAAIAWIHADALALPLRDGSVDRVIGSLLVHQLEDRARAFLRVARVLKSDGRFLIRTVLPEAAAGRIPERYFPSVAQAWAARMPTLDQLLDELRTAGFDSVTVTTVKRNKRINLAEVEAAFRDDATRRYPFLTREELAEGIAALREAAPQVGEWTDPRPATFLVGAQ